MNSFGSYVNPDGSNFGPQLACSPEVWTLTIDLMPWRWNSDMVFLMLALFGRAMATRSSVIQLLQKAVHGVS